MTTKLTARDPELEGVASRIRTVVEAIGTQLEAAEVAGISIAQLRNYLGARHSPSAFPLARLAAATGYSLEWIISGTGPERTGEQKRLAPGSGGELVALSSSPSAARMAARESPLYAKIVERNRELYGTEEEQRVRGMLKAAGLSGATSCEPELDFVLDQPMRRLHEMEGAIAREILKEDPAAWPALVRIAVESQKALARHVAAALRESRPT